MTLNEDRNSWHRFVTAIKTARTQRFERGSFSAANILEDVITADKKTWMDVRDHLARQMAIDLIKRLVTTAGKAPTLDRWSAL